MRCLGMFVLAAALLAGVAPAGAQIRPKAGFRIPGKGPFGRRDAAQFQRQLERLQRMSPAQRRQALRSLPPERREQFEKRLEEYQHMTPDERQRLARQLNNFRQLPPERQKAIREMRQKFADMDPQRRRMMAREVQELRGLDDEERENRLNSPALRERFNEEERQMLQDLSSVLEPEE